ncbi:hypothetical protein CEXT_29281 [Caerostris extrusa]|uniref:Uncharacterized protein n=1 Tax=Caerostris extrusa TaxID=172846 RepID=A0AAV4QB28_CAEEX|nr:hypothetical protein CEXT_29281 [Caerostris extrusa]
MLRLLEGKYCSGGKNGELSSSNKVSPRTLAITAHTAKDLYLKRNLLLYLWLHIDETNSKAKTQTWASHSTSPKAVLKTENFSMNWEHKSDYSFQGKKPHVGSDITRTGMKLNAFLANSSISSREGVN